MTKMVNIKNNKDFYDKLHELEDLDPDWFIHVGQESRLNTYIDDGDLNTALKEVKDDSIICINNNKEIEIKCDSVISSAGYIPDPLSPKKKNVYLIGDCDKVGNLRTVIWKAYECAMKI